MFGVKLGINSYVVLLSSLLSGHLGQSLKARVFLLLSPLLSLLLLSSVHHDRHHIVHFEGREGGGECGGNRALPHVAPGEEPAPSGPSSLGQEEGGVVCASVSSPSRYIPSHKRPPLSSCPNDDGPDRAGSSPGATGGRARLPPHSPPPSRPSSPSSLPRPRAALHPPSVIRGGGYYLQFARAGVRNASR